MIEPITTCANGLGSGAEALNAACFCISLDEAALGRALDAELGEPGLAALVAARCPYLFSARPVFLSATRLRQIADVVCAVEAVVAQPAYRELALADAPAIAHYGAAGVRGVFFGFDFHFGRDHLGLIEINTNAGGALLNAALARAQRACCAAITPLAPHERGAADFEQAIVDMFHAEWRAAGRAEPLQRIAIVDAAPTEQYLYPEFRLFQRLLARNGLQAVIADPRELAYDNRKLWYADLPIDLVYNRLTDFYLEAPESAALREAYLADAVVLTPHPQAYALYADKRRLVTLSDPDALEALGVSPQARATLAAHVPRTVRVQRSDAQALWDARRLYFFKPVSGYGSRAAYRGDKLTKRVWQEILAGDYVAQALVAPGERPVPGEPPGAPLKFDVRSYVYAGQVQWTAARVYQGQTTNFRTEGGGFAPVYSVADDAGSGAGLDRGSAVSSSAGCPAPQADAYASYVFLLDENGGVHPLPHGLYVALARAEAASEALAGRRFRLVDWYVRMQHGAPQAVVNETCTEVVFDTQGRLDVRARPESGIASAWPSADERRRMHAMVFGLPAAAATGALPDPPAARQ